VPNSAQETPALVIARKAPEVGEEVTSIGFPGDIQDITDQSQIARASFKNGTVSSRQVTPSGVVQIEVSSTLAGGMSGGPTVNKDEQVVGVNSNGLTRAANFNFITNTPDLRSFLQTHNVVLAEPPAPKSGGLGVVWYVIGAAALALLAAGGAALVILRRRRARTPEAGPALPGSTREGPAPGPVTAAEPTPESVTWPGAEGPRDAAAAAEPAGSGALLSAPGLAAEANFCPHCGAPHRHDDPFCPACGKPVA